MVIPVEMYEVDQTKRGRSPLVAAEIASHVLCSKLPLSCGFGPLIKPDRRFPSGDDYAKVGHRQTITPLLNGPQSVHLSKGCSTTVGSSQSNL